ncbi:hypothetical protein DY000_02053413 [Brassica cretica]|uniref:Uncharacterized protein n=1 Tax=Brassica cretica TaxID=69181 RepID=A0ABQ7AF38_BRACR|nr:hypothetical protein DY000_02053413 [Brassica cretica]
MQFALCSFTSDEVHHAIFKASRVVYSASYNLLHGNDELLITDMPKEEVERYHLSLEDLFFSSCFGEDSSERLKLLFDAYKDSDFTRTGSINGL